MTGPFNGLCGIESSRGSPGISDIFLPICCSSFSFALFEQSLLSLSSLSTISSFPHVRSRVKKFDSSLICGTLIKKVNTEV